MHPQQIDQLREMSPLYSERQLRELFKISADDFKAIVSRPDFPRPEIRDGQPAWRSFDICKLLARDPALRNWLFLPERRTRLLE